MTRSSWPHPAALLLSLASIAYIATGGPAWAEESAAETSGAEPPLAARPSALQPDAVAGVLGERPVTLGEIDGHLDGQIQKIWGEVGSVQGAAAAAICGDRAAQALAKERGVSEEDWWVEQWLAAVGPTHEARVRAYRQGIATASKKWLETAGPLRLAARPASRGEPLLADPVGTCAGKPISRDELERYASFPLYRRRAQVAAIACRQFEVDFANPLLVAHEAEKRGVSKEALLEEIDAGGEDIPPPSEEQVERLAQKRYGKAGESERSKVRLVLQATSRARRRTDWLQGLIRKTEGRCDLVLPDAPVAWLPGHVVGRGQPLPVSYFGSFRCAHCATSWSTLRGLQKEWGDRIAVRFRHHFPDAAEPWFQDALDAECAAAQGKLFAYGDWRFSKDGTTDVVAALGVDSESFQACRADPKTAVRILRDTNEALRMGFREALPSWVVGRRPRRGLQGRAILDSTIRKELGLTPAP